VNATDPVSPLDIAAARAAFVAAMQTPGAYAALHAVDATIRCIETHVSWVFLTGPFAYKVKKPLRLSFLDYSTVARREHFCREELRLNRRHAPDLYVDVVPIAGSADAPQVGVTGGAAFEHALRMLQFDPGQELGHLLLSNAVTTDDVASLGTDLARLHASAARADATSPHGSPCGVHRVTLDNFEEIARVLPQTRADLAAMQSVVERAYAAVSDLMGLRKAQGHVRECHGDLHCGNVVRWRGRLVPFDGLEFDPALRYIDVASDAGFLSMDLAAHDRPDLRHVLLDSWTAASGDYAAIELLPYYEQYRALVRAKVAALRGQQQASGASNVEATSLAHRYLGWARQQSARRPPALVLMAGLSGSGKTWLARRIATAIGALHVRSDVERKRLAGLGPLESSRSAPDAGIYTQDFNTRTYTHVCACARHCLRGGESVVIDAANLRQDERAAFVRTAQELALSTTIVHCRAPIEVLRRRVAHRQAAGRDASEATVALLDRQPSYWEPLTAAERESVLEVDTGQPDEVAGVLQALARRSRRN
jgi:uncharacterized protein